MAMLNVSLNLLSGNTIRKAAGDVKVLNSALGNTGGVLSSLKNKMDFTRKLMGFASASVLVSNFTAGIKSAVGAVENLVGVVGKFAEQGDRIAKTSRLVGLSVNDYQAFDNAAKHAGMSTEELDSALKKFNVNLGKARSGDKTAFKVFDAILGGRKVSDFKDSTALLKGIADGYTKLATAEQKAFVSQELFGRSGLKMTEMLSGGSEAIQKMIDDFEALGGGFSEEVARNAEAFDDALQDMRGTIESIKISVMQELFPTFTDLFKTVQAFVKDNGPKIKEQVGFVVNSVGQLVKSLLPYIPKVLGVVVKLVDTIGPGVLAILAGFTGIMAVVAPLVPGLMAAASLISGPLLSGIGALVSFGGTLASIGGSILTALQMTAAVLGGPVIASIGLVVAAAVSWGIAIKSVIDNVNLLPDAIEWIWTTAKESFDYWLSSIKSGLSSLGEWLRSMPILGTISKFFSSDVAFDTPGGLGASVGQMVSESRTTTTNRFSVDFKNMPKGVQVTPPAQGDFDYSRGYLLGGA